MEGLILFKIAQFIILFTSVAFVSDLRKKGVTPRIWYLLR